MGFNSVTSLVNTISALQPFFFKFYLTLWLPHLFQRVGGFSRSDLKGVERSGGGGGGGNSGWGGEIESIMQVKSTSLILAVVGNKDWPLGFLFCFVFCNLTVWLSVWIIKMALDQGSSKWSVSTTKSQRDNPFLFLLLLFMLLLVKMIFLKLFSYNVWGVVSNNLKRSRKSWWAEVFGGSYCRWRLGFSPEALRPGYEWSSGFCGHPCWLGLGNFLLASPLILVVGSQQGAVLPNLVNICN